MKKIRLMLRALFGFSRREGNAMIILMAISVISIFLPVFVRLLDHPQSSQKKEFQEWYESVSSSVQKKEAAFTPVPRKRVKFDPNVCSERLLIELGFQPFIAKRIISFREAGGSFKTANDLLRVYGIDSLLVGELSPWVVVSNQEKDPVAVKKDFSPQVHPQPSERAKPKSKIELNDATDTAFQAIRGLVRFFQKGL